jgi:hypothetical protein
MNCPTCRAKSIENKSLRDQVSSQKSEAELLERQIAILLDRINLSGTDCNLISCPCVSKMCHLKCVETLKKWSFKKAGRDLLREKTRMSRISTKNR